VPVVNRDVRAIRNAWIFALGYRRVLTVVHAHHDAPRGATTATIAVFADLVAHYTTADSADDGCRRAAVTLADGATQHATGDRADHRAQGAAVAVATALYIHLIHLLHHAAVLATRGVSRTLLIAAVLGRCATRKGRARRHNQSQGTLKGS